MFLFGFYRPLSSSTIARRLKDAVKKENDEEHDLLLIRVHDFRHSHAYYLINNRSDKFIDFYIADRLGDIVNTLYDMYTHLFSIDDAPILDLHN